MKNLSVIARAYAISWCLVSATAVAEPTTLTFSQPDFEWYQSSGVYFPLNHIWEVGDFWAQNFPGTALESATTMSLTLAVDDNQLGSGSVLNLGVFLNASQVGNLSISSETFGTQTSSFSFPAVSGYDYRIELRVVDRIWFAGCAAITIDGPSFAVLE